jgi:hypothetical protein
MLTNMKTEYITLDTNQHDATVEQAIFDYADLAYNTGYKDVQLVFTPLLYMERSNFNIHPDQVATKPQLSPGDQRLLANRDRIRLIPFNEYDYDYMHKLSAAFKEHLTADAQALLAPETIERVKNAAFALKKAEAILQDPPYDTCPLSADQIDPFHFDDLAVTAALYGVSGTRKFVHPHMKEDKFNSADYSMIAAFENHLSSIITSEEERSARTIFISQDNMLQDELIKAAQQAKSLHKAELHNRDSIMEYIQEELVNIRRHMRAQDIALDDSDTLSLVRLDAALQAWAKDRKQAEITR